MGRQRNAIVTAWTRCEVSIEYNLNNTISKNEKFAQEVATWLGGLVKCDLWGCSQFLGF